MGRWYQTSNSQFIDYNQQAGAGKGTGSTTALSLVGDLKVHPDDYARHAEKLAEVDARINEITARVQADPRKANSQAPAVQQLRQQIQQDLQAGEWAAMLERQRLYETHMKSLDELAKKDRPLATMAANNYKMPALDYDPQTRTFGKPQLEPLATWTPEQMNQWKTTTKGLLKEGIIGKLGGIEQTKKLNGMQSIITVGEMVGITPDQILETAVNSVPEEALAAAETRRRYVDRSLGRDSGVKEREFYTRGADGKIKLNLDTEMGQQVQSMVDGLAYENFKGTRVNFKDEYAVIAARGREARKTAAYRASLGTNGKQDVTEFFPKLQALYRGEGYNAPDSDPLIKKDNTFEGVKYGGGLVSHIEKEAGKKPVIVFNVPRKTSVGTSVDVKRQELDYDALSQLLNAKSFAKLKQDATVAGAWTPERVVKLDHTVDATDTEDEVMDAHIMDEYGNVRAITPAQEASAKKGLPKGQKIVYIGRRTKKFRDDNPVFSAEDIEKAYETTTIDDQEVDIIPELEEEIQE